MRIGSPHREAELRFGHPYAVVALTTDRAADGRPRPELSAWHGLPVFSAWVSEPEDASDDEQEEAGETSHLFSPIGAAAGRPERQTHRAG